MQHAPSGTYGAATSTVDTFAISEATAKMRTVTACLLAMAAGTGALPSDGISFLASIIDDEIGIIDKAMGEQEQ